MKYFFSKPGCQSSRTQELSLAINMFDIECHKARVGSFYGRCVMNIRQMFRKKNNVSFKSESSYRQKNLSKTPVSIFVFVSLLIVAYFLLKLIMEGMESNAGPSHGWAYGIKKAVLGTFYQRMTRFGETEAIQYTINAFFAIIFFVIKTFHSGKKLKLITY